MTPITALTPGEQLAAHSQQLRDLDERQKTHDARVSSLGEKIDRLQYWIMGALLSSLASALAALLHK